MLIRLPGIHITSHLYWITRGRQFVFPTVSTVASVIFSTCAYNIKRKVADISNLTAPFFAFANSNVISETTRNLTAQWSFRLSGLLIPASPSTIPRSKVWFGEASQSLLCVLEAVGWHVAAVGISLFMSWLAVVVSCSMESRMSMELGEFKKF